MIDLFRVAMSPEAKDRVADVLTPDPFGRLYIGQGNEVDAFETALAGLLDLSAPPLTTNSCTSAIDLALHLIGVGPGDCVLTTPVTCTATNSPIVNRGAVPYWVDVDPLTGLIDPSKIEEAIERACRDYTPVAIMAVDWGGALCDYNALKRFGLPVIQDAAHHLTTPQGDYACYSFQAIKFLTCGDGGALWCPPEQMERARLLRWYGLDRRSKTDFRCEQNIQEVGFKYHMNDIAAAIGLANIRATKGLIQLHRDHATEYSLCLNGEVAPGHNQSACWLYTLLVEDRAGFIAHMAERGIACSPVHARNDTHAAFHFPNGPLPGVDHFAARNVAIPVGWWLSAEDRRTVIEAVQSWQ